MQHRGDNQRGNGDRNWRPSSQQHRSAPSSDEDTVRGLVRTKQFRTAEAIIRESLTKPQDCSISYLVFMAGFSAHNPNAGLLAPDQLVAMALARLNGQQAEQKLCDDLTNTAHTIFKRRHSHDSLMSGVRILDMVLSYYPADTRALHQKINLFSEMGDFKAARCSAEDYVKKHPGSHDAHNCLGKILYKMGLYNEALGEFQTALEICPSDSAAYAGISKAKHVLGFFDEALTAIEKANELAPNDKVHLLRWAQLLDSLQQDDSALEKVNLSLVVDPQFKHALLEKSQILEKMGRQEEALQVANEGLRYYPGSSSLLLRKATILVHKEHHQSALPCVQEVLRYQPCDITALCLYGRILSHQKDNDAALAVYAKANQLEPDNRKVLVGYSKALSIVGMHEEAAKKATRLLELSPNDPIAIERMSQTLMQQGEIPKAVLMLEQVVNQHPDHALCVKTLARELLDQGKIVEAYNYLEKMLAFKRNKNDRAGVLLFAKAHCLLDCFEDAAKVVDALLLVNSTDTVALNFAGAIATQLEDYTKGLDIFKRNLQAHPEALIPQLAIAKILMANEDFGQAKPLLEALFKQHPENQDAACYLAFCHCRDEDWESAEAVLYGNNALLHTGAFNLRLGAVLAGNGQRDLNFEVQLASDCLADRIGLEAVSSLAKLYHRAKQSTKRALEELDDNFVAKPDMMKIITNYGISEHHQQRNDLEHH